MERWRGPGLAVVAPPGAGFDALSQRFRAELGVRAHGAVRFPQRCRLTALRTELTERNGFPMRARAALRRGLSGVCPALCAG